MTTAVDLGAARQTRAVRRTWFPVDRRRRNGGSLLAQQAAAAAASPRGHIEVTQAKADFSEAFFAALAAVARCTLKIERPDVHGIDVQVAAEYEDVPGEFDFGVIDVQLKCTKHTNVDSIPVKLKKRQFDRLRAKSSVPRILVAVHVPSDDSEEWISVEPDQLLLNHAAYWTSLRGADAVDQDEIAVAVPKAQRLDVDELCRLLNLSRLQQPLGDN